MKIAIFSMTAIHVVSCVRSGTLEYNMSHSVFIYIRMISLSA